MSKIIAIFVFILMAATLASCSAKSQEQAVPQTETALENNTTVVEEKAPVVETAKEQAQTIAKTSPAQTVSSQEGITSSSSEVVVKPTNEEIQKALKNAGLYDGSVDGVIGKRTKKAIEDFQSQNNLTIDGKVGRQTWDKLNTYLSAPPVNSTSD